MFEDRRFRELVEQGWRQRFVACEPRLSELVSLYQDLGYDVRLEPLPEHSDDAACQDECSVCFQENRDGYRVVFTRKSE